MKHLYYFICGVIIFVLNPILVGLTTGWLMGVSPTPAVSAVLPLVFGFLGMLGIGATARLFGSTAPGDSGGQKKSDNPSNADRNSADPWGEQLRLLGYLAISCICFCIPFYWGCYNGIANRNPSYPSPLESFENLQLRTDEIGALENLRGVLRHENIPVADYQAVLAEVFVPIVKGYPASYGGPADVPINDMRHQRFFDALSTVLQQLVNAKQSASEDTSKPPVTAPARAPEAAPAPAPPTEPKA